jgi:TonB family protein
VADYPRESVIQGEQGVVSLRFLVTETGNVSECNVESSSGYPKLDDAGCAVAGRWKYEPATRGGSPTSSFETADLVFRIAGPLDSPAALRPAPGASDPTLDIPDSYKSEALPRPAPRLPPGFIPPELLTSNAALMSEVPVRVDHEGPVAVLYIVNETGDVSECAVVNSSRFASLDEAACALAGRRKYKPATQHGKPTSAFIKTVFFFGQR